MLLLPAIDFSAIFISYPEIRRIHYGVAKKSG